MSFDVTMVSTARRVVGLTVVTIRTISKPGITFFTRSGLMKRLVYLGWIAVAMDEVLQADDAGVPAGFEGAAYHCVLLWICCG